MASSYSTDLKLELMVTGENAGTWGDKTNTNLNLVQQAIAGVESIALTDGGTVTLVMSDAAISNARNMVLKLTGTLTTASNLAIPDSIEKFYIIDATAVTGPTNLTVKTVSGTGFTLDQAKIYACYTDGTNVTEVSLDTLGGTVAAANISGTIATAQIADNAITTAKISDNQVTTAKISDNQITTAKISDNQITTAKIANDAVGPDQLSNTAVTPGAYTTADITVDAQGRITAASSGAAGSITDVALVAESGSGTYSSNGTAGEAYMYAGGGGGGGGNFSPGGRGGDGGFGLFQFPISAPFSQPYSVGAPGNPGPGRSAGGAGGATTIANVGTVNGGNGGAQGQPPSVNPPGNPGNPGSAPGATFTWPNSTLFHSAGQRVGGNSGPSGNQPGGAGGPGLLVVYDA